MSFVSCRLLGREFAARLDGESVKPIAGISELGAGVPLMSLDELPLTGETFSVDEVELRPVIPRPARIICLGLNYESHVGETKREMPEYPVLFCKFAPSLIGARDAIVKPRESNQVDYEAELAVIVGRRVRRASRADGLDSVAGFCIANDVTIRDFQYKTHQWLQGKAWDQTTPLGPALVPASQAGDGSGLAISLSLNGTELQASSTSHMIFSVPEIIERISQFATLEPGDVILTGTPGGVGYRRDPQVFLEEGDTVTVTIDGLGVLTNPVITEQAHASAQAAKPA